jgi:hypothetical protein
VLPIDWQFFTSKSTNFACAFYSPVDCIPRNRLLCIDINVAKVCGKLVADVAEILKSPSVFGPQINNARKYLKSRFGYEITSQTVHQIFKFRIVMRSVFSSYLSFASLREQTEFRSGQVARPIGLNLNLGWHVVSMTEKEGRNNLVEPGPSELKDSVGQPSESGTLSNKPIVSGCRLELVAKEVNLQPDHENRFREVWLFLCHREFCC